MFMILRSIGPLYLRIENREIKNCPERYLLIKLAFFLVEVINS